MRKSIFFLLLALMVSSRAISDDVLIDGLYYLLNDEYNTAEVMRGGAYSGAVVIPSYVTYNEKQYNVTSIGDKAFMNCTGLTSVTIGNCVTNIGNYAFYLCTGLTSVIIPNSVTIIGNYAFYNCSGLTSVTIGNGVMSIGSSAFYYCKGLTSVTIGNSVTSIGDRAFSGCNSLPIFDNIRYADTYLVEAVDKSLSTYQIKEGTKWIGSSAFSGCFGLTSVTIPISLISIGDKAFSGYSNITSVVWNAKNCTSYDFGNLVESFIFGNEVEVIPSSICKGMTKLTAITIPNSVTSIGDKAFGDCTGLTSVNIGNSVTSIGSYAFGSCSGLTSVTIPNSVTSIGGRAFRFCTGLTSVTIGNSVTSIGDWVFSGCSGLTSVTIPNSVTSIGERAFTECYSLKEIDIPNSVTNIGAGAFSYCTSLTSVTCEAISPPELLGNSVFFRVPCSDIPLYVPAQSVSDYKAAEQWKEFKPILPIGFVGYTITFNNWDGTELLKLTCVEHGTIPVYTGNTPTRPDDAFYTYTFKGWSPNIVEATQDATYVAVYDEHPRTTDIKEVSAKTNVVKILRNGQLYILRNGKAYSVQGQEVK